MRCHRKSNQVVSLEVAGCLRLTLAAVPFKVAIQHPGSSSPPSLFRWGCCSWMSIASFSNSSLSVLAWSITVFKARASGRNVSKVFNPVVKLVLENYPYSCLSQLRSPHFNHGQACANYSHTVSGPIGLNKNQA